MSADLVRAGRSLADLLRASVVLLDDRHGHYQGFGWCPDPGKKACIPAPPVDELFARFKRLLDTVECRSGRLGQLAMELEAELHLKRRGPSDESGVPRYCLLRIMRRWADELERELSNCEVGLKSTLNRRRMEHGSTRKPGARSKTGGRRGRRTGVDKIGEALMKVTTQLKDGGPVAISTIARMVGCTTKNLKQSDRFMRNYEMLIAASRRAARRGTKNGGIADAADYD